MLALKVFRSPAKGVADLLPWAALIDEGVVLNKDGSLLAGFYYQGPDLASSTPHERNYLTERVNAALARLDNGWVSWQDASRLPAANYPAYDLSAFPDPITRMIDEERRSQFMAEGAHYECEYVVTLQYMPPLRRNARIADLVYSETDESGKETPAERILASFKRTLNELEDTLGGVLKIRRMGAFTYLDAQGRRHMQDELVNYLHFCVSGSTCGVNIPPSGMYLDAVLGGVELWPGDQLKLDEGFISCVAIEGFPAESYPGVLDALDHVAVPYRWSTRFIYLDAGNATTQLLRYKRKWKQKERGFVAQVLRTPGGTVDQDALLMAAQAEAAISDAKSGLVVFGYYTPVVVLRANDPARLTEASRLVKREVERQGFGCRVESVNCMESWLGSLPGNALQNVRRPMIHTLNLADLLPLASVWPGREVAPCPFYPPKAPALIHAATTGATPFRVNLHVGDVGHTLILGPTGAGKSCLLAVLAAQFRRYRNATVWAFDKGRSMMPLALAVGGHHYDINGGEGTKLAFCPLQRIDSLSDAAWAEEWIASLYALEANERTTVEQNVEIHRAITLLREAPVKQRSLSHFASTVQSMELRAALSHYTVDGSMGHLLDDCEDGLVENPFQVFELEELMPLGEKNVLPVLLYLFRRFEQALKGQPALLILDEAWLLLKHEVFRNKIVEWLKVLRKANCAVVLSTQSLSDAVHSGIMDVLQESCPTKILLPNEEADKAGTPEYPGPRDLYMMLGLNETQIQILKHGTKKRHYYYLSTEGRRQFELGLGPLALSFVGVSDREGLARVKEMALKHGTEWPYEWLKARRVNYEQYV